MFPAAVPVGAEVSAALLQIGSFSAADSFKSPVSKGTDKLLLSPLEDSGVKAAAVPNLQIQFNVDFCRLHFYLSGQNIGV